MECSSIDKRRRCRLCNNPLRYGNKSGLCRDCYAALPAMAKAARATSATDMLACAARTFIDLFDAERAAQLLDVDDVTLSAILTGDLDLTPAATITPPHQEIAQPRAEAPLSHEASAIIAPWRLALRQEAASLLSSHRQRRRLLIERRGPQRRWVPPLDACLTPGIVGNSYGRANRRGRPRAGLPMRICVGLWSLGFSTRLIERITARCGRPVKFTVIARLLKQAKLPFEGAEAVRAGDLAAELDDRPLAFSVFAPSEGPE